MWCELVVEAEWGWWWWLPCFFFFFWQLTRGCLSSLCPQICSSFKHNERTLVNYSHACRSHGHALFPPSYGPVSFISVDSQRESAANEWSQQHQYANMPFAYYPQSSFGPLGYPGANMPVGDGSRSNLSTSDTQLEAHRIFLQQQCEVWTFVWWICTLFYVCWYC